MRIATWNINSVRLRVELVLAYLRDVSPDVLCLQEIKCETPAFPRLEFEAAGYNVAVHGQKSYNGVALLSKAPMEIVAGLPGDEGDEQSRYIEAVMPFGPRAVRVGCLYLPNGNPLGTEKYAYKLAWMDRLIVHARETLKHEEIFVLAGDYNVIPDARDVHDPAAVDGRRALRLADARKIPRAFGARFHRRPARHHGRGEAIHVLGLSGGLLAEKPGVAHRPPAAVAAGRRPSDGREDRPGHAREGQAVGPCADQDRFAGLRRAGQNARGCD